MLVSNYASQIFYDNDIDSEESYCYRIVLLDIQGEEFITSLEQCIEGAIIQCPVIGDTNGDNSLNVLDVVTMVSHILGNSLLSDDQLRCTDFNQDNALNDLDVVVAVSVILAN